MRESDRLQSTHPQTFRRRLDTISKVTISDLAGVVYSSGKVFDGLSTGRLDTENFLRSGSLKGVTSRSDLALLEDLRDVSQFIIDHSDDPIDSTFVKAVNAQLTLSAAFHPGEPRTQEQKIVVKTRYGRHEPDPLNHQSLRRLLDEAMLARTDVEEQALEVFVQLAKAQPFEDGNKRTALFVANTLLIGTGSGKLLTIPLDEDDPSIADSFNDLLARAYVFNEHDGVKDLLRERGITPLKQATRKT